MGLRIGMVVGEASGDALAAALVQELIHLVPNVEIEGILGPKVLAMGNCRQLFSMDSLNIMGFGFSWRKILAIYRMRRWLIQYFKDDPPDLFIGVDAPDFNLSLEKALKQAAIPVVHYVSPTVWAWRPWRVRLIRKAVDLLLVLFPFEEQFLLKHQIPAKFIGHPAADRIPLQIDSRNARRQLAALLQKEVAESATYIAILPGSRWSELQYMLPLYLQVASLCLASGRKLQFIIPLINPAHQSYLETLVQTVAPELPYFTVLNNTDVAIAACDIALVTSGTATLEVMLHQKPMIIAYKTNWLTYCIAKCLIKIPFIGLPNILANQRIVPEFIQRQATAPEIARTLLSLLQQPEKQRWQTIAFHTWHLRLQKQAGVSSAQAILQLLGLGSATC
jgi:lipid-A-disaccharide synthase